MAVWLENMERLLKQKDVLILHGNIRDTAFLMEDGNHFSGLSKLIRDTARKHDFSCVRFWGMMPKLDDPTKELPIWRTERIERLDGAAPPVNRKVGDGDNVLSQLLNSWHQDEVRKTNEKTLFVIYHIDKLTPFSQSCSYGQDVGLLVSLIQKIIGNMADNNKLIMVALRDTMIPLEYYTNSPRVALLEIPMPGREERRAFFGKDFATKGLNLECLDVLANITDGLYALDLENIAKAVRKETASQPELSNSTLRKLVNRYRIGSEDDPWSALSIEGSPKGLKDCAESWFKGKIIGQDHAVVEVVRAIKKARAGVAGLVSGQASKPRGVFFFAGPTGVGKTFLAKKLAEFLFDTEEAFTRFDMSEFKEEHTISKLIGAPPGYVGYERGGELTNKIRNRPFSIVLFDEIEKAHPKILDIFLQILDDGRLTDSRGQTVFFTESVIIFTSNIGTRSTDSRGRPIREKKDLDNILAEENDAHKANLRVRKHFTDSVRNFFQEEISRPELLNRIGSQIIAFNFINGDEAIEQIITNTLNEITLNFRDKFSKRNFSLAFDNPEVKNYLKDCHGQHISRFGGRGLLSVIDDEIGYLLADHLLFAESRGLSEMPLRISTKTVKTASGETVKLICKQDTTA